MGHCAAGVRDQNWSRNNPLDVSGGNVNQSKADQSKVAKMVLSGLAPMSEQNGGSRITLPSGRLLGG
jgi:hypothetical protein